MRNRSEDKIALVMIRHGATQANKEQRYLGRTDEPLLEEEKHILSEYKRRAFYPDVNVLFVSPMARCVQTAKILYPNLQPILIPEWREMDFGAFENKNYEELKDDMRYQQWIEEGGTGAFPDGEDRDGFILRCKGGFGRMAAGLSKMLKTRNQRVGLIVHGGTIMALLSTYGGGDYFDYQVQNGMGYTCIWDRADRISEITLIGK